MSLSTVAKSAIFAQNTTEVFITLLTLDSTELSTSINVAANYENVVSNGTTYVAFPFNLRLPSQQDENMPSASIEIDNIDRTIVNAVRTLTAPADVSIKIVLASSPDTYEYESPTFKLKGVTWDANVVRGSLTFDTIFGKKFPGEDMTPDLFPGMY